jgi:murein DD-endopeptidase MepM/ murein hydrolase activator NlpD
MLAALWTATVRAIAVLTAILAIGVIIVSLQAARAQAGPPDGETGMPTQSSDVPDEAQPLQPVRATTQTSPAPTASQATPAIRYAAPSEALPATRARSISGQTHVSGSPPSSLPANRRLTAVLDVGTSSTADTMEVALLTKQTLEAQGYDVSLLEGDAADNGAGPLRPDAYVAIRPAPGANADTGVEAWFCQVEGSLGGQLADLLLRSLAAAGLPNVGQGDGDIADPDAFDCGVLVAGRARMPAVLLEVPTFTAGDSEGQALAQGLADGIHQFFQKYRTSLLQEDQRRRLVWPALGPITSYFGPSHPLGIDIGQSEGSVVAATDGVVVFAGGNPCCSYGLYVVVDSTEGIITLYAHLESISVTEGQRVRQGQPLGVVGCTGHCFGTHLHFEVIDEGVRRDPLSYLP